MKILVTDGMDKKAVAKLEKQNHQVIQEFYEVEKLNEVIKDVDVIVIRSATKIRKETIDAALTTKRLKVIIRAGVGIDNIDHVYAQSKGITVRNTPYASSSAVAELALGHMFAVSRFIGISNVTMRDEKWNKKAYKGSELAGKTLGLIGFGRIAQSLAFKASAIGMKIIYHNRSGAKSEFPTFKYVSLDKLLSTSDYVSLHIPSTGGKPYIGEEEISKMKDGVFLINTARGAVVSEDALLAALESGKIAGAGLDVFVDEPTNNHKLINNDRVSATPHIGASTGEAQTRIGEEIISVIESIEV